MSEKIYILTEGDYSDYAIKGVFLDKAEAERVAKKFVYRLEEYENGKLEDDGFECFPEIIDTLYNIFNDLKSGGIK